MDQKNLDLELTPAHIIYSQFVLIQRNLALTSLLERIMKTTVLAIDGMHCNGCVQIIQHLLEQQAGVKGCSVSLDSKRARIAHDADRISAETLADAVRAAGYEAASTES